MVDEALGEAFGGILVSDFYVAYHHYPGLKQRCRPHLLRDIHKLKVLYPEDQGLAKWARGVQRLYTKGVSWAVAGDCSSRGAVGPGKAVAQAVPAFPGGPVGSPGETVPAD